MDLQIRQVDELIKYYEDELLYNSKQEQSNIKDRNYVLAQKYKDWNTIILEFIDNLKNLKPNELKGVSNNEQKEKIYCSKCQQEFINRGIFTEQERDKELT